MLLYILAVLSVVACVLAVKIESPALEVIGILGLLLFGIAAPINHVRSVEFVATYPQMKSFYENYEMKSEYDTVKLITEVAELNEHLFSAQWTKRTWGFMSVYPKAVLDLEPIQ